MKIEQVTRHAGILPRKFCNHQNPLKSAECPFPKLGNHAQIDLMVEAGARPLGKKTAEFVKVMQVFAVIYAAVGLFFFMLHAVLAQWLRMEAAPNRFWVVLTLSMMLMLSFLSWQSSRKPNDAAFVHCHLLSKAVSVTGFLISYALEPAVWGHIVGAVTDGAVFITVGFFYLRAQSEMRSVTLAETRV